MYVCHKKQLAKKCIRGESSQDVHWYLLGGFEKLTGALQVSFVQSVLVPACNYCLVGDFFAFPSLLFLVTCDCLVEVNIR